jgi:hypothetical protein
MFIYQANPRETHFLNLAAACGSRSLVMLVPSL